jgi:hypothetical protein
MFPFSLMCLLLFGRNRAKSRSTARLILELDLGQLVPGLPLRLNKHPFLQRPVAAILKGDEQLRRMVSGAETKAADRAPRDQLPSGRGIMTDFQLPRLHGEVSSHDDSVRDEGRPRWA